VAGREDVEERRLHRNEDPIDLLDDRVERLAVQACRRVEDDVRGALRWAAVFPGSISQLRIVGRIDGRKRSHSRDDC
jgi:hypothetical protein